jgi:hypothetical protein
VLEPHPHWKAHECPGVEADISPAQSSLPRGLSSQDAPDGLSEYGPNDPTAVTRGATITELLILFLKPLVVILLIASLVSIVLGNRADAAIILVIVLLSISINFVQTCSGDDQIDLMAVGEPLQPLPGRAFFDQGQKGHPRGVRHLAGARNVSSRWPNPDSLSIKMPRNN